jgi:glycosyltransferase involved in cell wall biosynthesis
LKVDKQPLMPLDEHYKLTVIIPAFNEAENLKIILPPLISLSGQKKWKIIIVNDGSHDNTKEVLGMFPLSDHFSVVHHKLNKGYGAAIKTGISACDTEFCITIDADGQHQLEDIEKLFGRLLSKDADMVVGLRKGVKPGTYTRRIGKSIIRILAKMLMYVPIHDINSGMKVCRTDLARKYMYLAPDTMSFSDIITLVFINNRHLVLEEPITLTPRLNGKSTIGVETAFQTVMEIINIVILFNPMKIFLPLSVIFILITLAWGVPLILKGHGVSTGTVLGFVSGLLFFLLGLIAEQLSLLRRKQN